MGSKGLADAFSRMPLKAPTQERTVVYMISVFLTPYSWLNGVALALVPPRGPGGASYWYLEGWKEWMWGMARQDYASVNGRRRGWSWRRREAIPLLEGETGQRKKMDERDAEGARGRKRGLGLVRVNIAASRAL